MITVTKDNNIATDMDDVDPLDELNEISDKSQIVETIETEKDPLEVLEQQDAEDIPEYNSELGSIVEEDSNPENKETEKSLSSEETDKDVQVPLMDVIDEVDINNKKSEDSKLSAKENTAPKPKLSKKSSKTESEEDTTKVIDDVKVDEDGVPLLNQFDSGAFKGVFHKVHVSKQHVTKIAMIVVGAIITLIGVLQAINDVVKISDNVMYGEHETVAMGLIFIGVIIIIFAFYKELLEFSGLNNLSNNLDSTNSDSDMPKPKHNNKRKKEEN